MKTLWFKAKVYGWGWYPSSWEGWLVMMAYLVSVVTLFRKIDAASHSGSDTLIAFFFPFILITLALVVVCIFTGERPRWRWGK